MINKHIAQYALFIHRYIWYTSLFNCSYFLQTELPPCNWILSWCSVFIVQWRAYITTVSCCVTLWTATGWIWSRFRPVTVCWRRESRGWTDSSRTSAPHGRTASLANGYQTLFDLNTLASVPLQSVMFSSRVRRCFSWAAGFTPVRRRLVLFLMVSWTSSWVRMIRALRRSAGSLSSNSFPCWTPTGSSGVITGQRSSVSACVYWTLMTISCFVQFSFYPFANVAFF